MKKLYIKQVFERTVDGDVLLVIKTYESEPAQPYQIIFVR